RRDRACPSGPGAVGEPARGRTGEGGGLQLGPRRRGDARRLREGTRGMSRIDVHLRSGPQMLQYQAIARRIGREQQGPVLDWGTGFGQVAKLLADEDVDVTPFEYRPDLPEGGRPLERYPELQANSSPDPVRLPFDDASFDAVLS